MTNVFDNFVAEQMRSPLFAEAYRHESAKIAAVDRVMNANPGRPVPKFQVAYYLEEKYEDNKGKQKTKYIHYLGEPVGLRSNFNSGAIQDVVWSDQFNQWAYTIYPWSEKQGTKRATEDVVLSIKDWLFDKIDAEVLETCENLSYDGDLNIIARCINNSYKALLSGRVVGPTRDVIVGIDRLVKEYKEITSRSTN